MKHFLAFGNSDQASFRDSTVRAAMDYMTVPGTIAAYYKDATAAFVLSSELDYVIDPRTPLFQDTIRDPRASHYSLAGFLGQRMENRMEAGRVAGSVDFPPSFFSQEVVDDLVDQAISLQRTYGSRADEVEEKLDRYRRLLATARGGATLPSRAAEHRPPAFVLAPYFVSADIHDEWWSVNERIWDRCGPISAEGPISPVLALEDSSLLERGLAELPEQLGPHTFFWIANFDERKVSRADLANVRDAVASNSGRALINLYGGFFSIALKTQGIWGVNNGLGYSESRDWPTLSSTGAAPARYYVPRLHMYLPPAQAQQVVDIDDSFSCDCATCQHASGQVIDLGYADLKRHFAAARRWEIDMVTNNSATEVARSLETAATRFKNHVLPRLPRRLSIPVDYLERWAQVIKS